MPDVAKSSSLPTVWFCYARPAGFSGQKEATEMVLRGLTARGWNCRSLPQPVLERERGGWFAVLRYGVALLVAWFRALRLLGSRSGRLCVNLGQTRAAFLRDSVPLWLGRMSFGRDQIIVSLHGSLFMQWRRGSLNASLFCSLLGHAGSVTVLGDKQRRHLLSLGLPAHRVRVQLNSCTVAPLSVAALEEKLAAAADASRSLRVLHLSSLIATKGFPDYLEALAALARRDGRPIEAVLCGRLTASEFQDRFRNEDEAERWILSHLAELNRSKRVRVQWVRGAVGAAKEELFCGADVFVLPTRYAVEAQPLVLIEAMASGCAIVTTTIGEISTILDDRTAAFVSPGEVDGLADTLEHLTTDSFTRAALARSAHQRFLDHHALDRHLDEWERELRGPSAPAALMSPAPRLTRT